MENSNETQAMKKELTFGEKAVGLTFNPSGDPAVNEVKKDYAKIIDQMHNLQFSGEQARYAAIAITLAEGAQMAAVKALSWKAD